MKKTLVAGLFLFASFTQADSETNKDLVVNFYQKALINQEVESAAMQYLSEDYIQHNPYVATGRQGFIDSLTGWLSSVDVSFEIVRVISENDYVVLHVRQTNNSKIASLIDILRIENGKIAEHWDVIQDVPQQMAQDSGMF